jgi:hypothetical protein
MDKFNEVKMSIYKKAALGALVFLVGIPAAIGVIVYLILS